MKADVEPLHEAPFHCEAILRSLPGVGLASFSISPNRIRRTPAMVADGNDDLVMVRLRTDDFVFSGSFE